MSELLYALGVGAQVAEVIEIGVVCVTVGLVILAVVAVWKVSKH